MPGILAIGIDGTGGGCAAATRTAPAGALVAVANPSAGATGGSAGRRVDRTPCTS
jgi:hypothetical protein